MTSEESQRFVQKVLVIVFSLLSAVLAYQAFFGKVSNPDPVDAQMFDDPINR